MTVAEHSGTEQGLRSPNTGSEVLRELARHGYVADTPSTEGQRPVLLRHPAAPDLLLRDDGFIELPLGQPLRNNATTGLDRVRGKVHWGRGVMVVLLLTLLSVFGLALVIGVSGVT